MTPFLVSSEGSLGDHLAQHLSKPWVTIRELTTQRGFGRLAQAVNKANAWRGTSGPDASFISGWNNHDKGR